MMRSDTQVFLINIYQAYLLILALGILLSNGRFSSRNTLEVWLVTLPVDARNELFKLVLFFRAHAN